MISKPISEVEETDLLSLIANEVSESRTIEYKRQLPGSDDADKKEFLADISSFANSSGGDLVFGLEESKGVPIALPGIQTSDPDLEIRRLESILASGLEPRIRYTLKLVGCKDGKKAIVFRIDRSWVGPHRVTFKGHDKFYGRNAGGKYSLDVSELRAAFAIPQSVSEKIRAFRIDRIIAISNNQTPVPMIEGPKLILHCIPLDSFVSNAQYDVLPFHQDPTKLPPMRAQSWGHRLNLDGVVSYPGQSPHWSYTQVYRNGPIEAVDANLLRDGKLRTPPMIPSIAYERDLLGYLPICFRAIRDLGASGAIIVALTLTGVKDFVMSVDNFYEFDTPRYAINQDSLILPEIVADDASAPPARILKPTFDLIWNACGYPSSRNFDHNGNWTARR